jgi:hypothetical protein
VHTLMWQKSTYSPDGSNCVYVAATPTGQIHLRESDEPGIVLTTNPDRLRGLIRSIKASPDTPRS